MLKETIGAVADMGQLSKIQEHLTAIITKCHESGQCPEEVWNAYEKFMEQYRAAENEKSDDSVAKGKKSMAAIHDFVTVLEKYEDKLPDNLQDEVEKFVKAANGLESLTDNILK